MSNSNSYIWIISGRVLRIDAETPFVKNDGLSVRIFNIGNSNPLGWYGIDDDDGNFSIILSKQQFGNANPELIIKVFDSQGRPLYASNKFTLPQNINSYSLGNVTATDMSVPSTWNIKPDKSNLKPIIGYTPKDRDLESFYFHDSTKKHTSGCIEVDKRFFEKLKEYRKEISKEKNKNIKVMVRYPNSNHVTRAR
jgi:hypothetical protein